MLTSTAFLRLLCAQETRAQGASLLITQSVRKSLKQKRSKKQICPHTRCQSSAACRRQFLIRTKNSLKFCPWRMLPSTAILISLNLFRYLHQHSLRLLRAQGASLRITVLVPKSLKRKCSKKQICSHTRCLSSAACRRQFSIIAPFDCFALRERSFELHYLFAKV